MESNSRRLTRSTYIGEPSSLHNRKTRSTSTDSENGWIPPPPLLSLNTKFLITNPQSRSHLSPSLSPSHSTDPISTGIAIAHLKCQPSNPSHHPELHHDLSTSFRLLEDHELALQPPSIDPSGSNQPDEPSDFIQTENKAFSRRHRQSEMIEKRSKKLEKEKLLHERFKLKDRLDILMKGSGAEWKSVRTLTLKRIKEDELKERSIGNPQFQSDNHPRETEFDKVERMRHIMIRETQEILKRYDKLLDTRKLSKPRKGDQSTVGKPPQQTSTPSNSQLKPLKHRSTPTSSKRKPTHQMSSDTDHPHKFTKRSHHQTISNLNINGSVRLQERDIPLHHYQGQIVTRNNNGRLSTSTSSPVIPAKSADLQLSKTVKIDNEQPPPIRSIPVPPRESLYDSVSIRRSAMDEQLLNGKKRIGRSTHALGCRLPDLNQIQLDYLAELQSMVPGKSVSPRTTPFDRPERQIPRDRKSISSSVNPTTERDDLKEIEDWIEFNPTVNEEKELISHQGEFGLQSKFFELDGELEYLEEQKMIQSDKNDKNDDDDNQSLNQKTGARFNQMIVGGKSIRKLIEERIQSWPK